MNKDFTSLPISTKNCFTFSKNTFNLSLFYEELTTFYNNVGLDNDIYYAHVFNQDGLFHNPYPISGFQIKKTDYNSSFFYLFSDKDITFATDMQNNEFKTIFNYVYKENILSLYSTILKTFEGDNTYNTLFTNNKITNVEFYLFISKICLNIPEFDLYKKEFFNLF
jgi:hypothetical protein